MKNFFYNQYQFYTFLILNKKWKNIIIIIIININIYIYYTYGSNNTIIRIYNNKKIKIKKKFKKNVCKNYQLSFSPKINSEEDIAILVKETKNYCERYFTYYTILYLEMENQYDKTQEEMLVYECMKELYDIPENHEVLTDYMALLCVKSKNEIY